MDGGGVSWLYSKLNAQFTDRIDFLAHHIANGVPVEEYKQMVGRYREVNRINDNLSELFEEFNKSEDETGEELGDLDES